MKISDVSRISCTGGILFFFLIKGLFIIVKLEEIQFADEILAK